jgi:hypothetical protein
MPAEFRMFFDNEAADEARLDMFSEIRIDQAMGMATEAELTINLMADSDGVWSDIADDWTQPFVRIRIEVKARRGDFVPLIDGPVVAQFFDLNSAPNQSKLVLTVNDDSVLLNRDEEVVLFEDMAASDVAQQVFAGGGLTPEVDTVPASGSTLDRVIVQRGTAMNLLRDLAKRHGMYAYVRPGEAPGQSIGVFERLDLTPADLPQLRILGGDRNLNRLKISFDAQRPIKACAGSVDAATRQIQTAESESPESTPLGDNGTHDIVDAGMTLLSRTREEQNDLEAATLATVEHSSWAYTADADLGENYPAVLEPYKVITVEGASDFLSGDYLVSRVTHTITDSGYRQSTTLRRNAHSEGGAAGLLGAIF